MKAHSAFLALTVLCLAMTASLPRARAQIPAESTKVEPSPSVAAAAEPRPPTSAPTAPPPTPVDTALPMPVHAPPLPAPAPPSQPAPSPSAATAPIRTEPRSPAPRGLGAPRWRDAHHDRLLIAPTAETNPSGSFYATSYEIVLLQIGYAVSDRTQISLTATPPLGDEAVIPGDISIKTVVLREPHVSVAAIASASGVLGFDEFSGFLGRAGGAVTLCAEARECSFSISVGTSLALAGPASVWFNGVGVNWRVGRIVSLIAEVDTLLPLAEPVGEANGVLGGAGVRLSGRAWGVDLALMKAGKARAQASDLIPFVAATYRYVP
jgi:hypothetical protein